VQQATLEASMTQHSLSVSWALICRSTSQYMQYSVYNYKQAAMREQAQTLQAGAVTCGQEHEQRVSRLA